MASPRVLLRPSAVLPARVFNSQAPRFVSTQSATPSADASKNNPKRKPLTKEQRDFLSSAVRTPPAPFRDDLPPAGCPGTRPLTSRSSASTRPASSPRH